MKRRRTPALVKIWAAIATRMFVGRVAQTMRMTIVVIRAMEKPKLNPDMRNLWPFLLLSCNIVMCPTAEPMKRRRKMADMGTSTRTVGTPPVKAPGGGYGGSDGGAGPDEDMLCSILALGKTKGGELLTPGWADMMSVSPP